MSELIAIDREGEAQYIWLQERAQSCGPACVYMIERFVRKACTVGGESRIRAIASLLPNGYREDTGTFGSALVIALASIGIAASAESSSDVSRFIGAARFPFIAHIRWPGGGGHFVVGGKKTRDGASLVCLDPWYGLSQTPVRSLPAYTVQENYREQVSMRTPQGGTFSGYFIRLD